ncbi:uncharacterized protein G2W53_001578 [Senna tora]|uniref:Uncharacterized protein n=1 Tax=Senna tora TaxID=362788 RepID=A0A834XG19_9FABA|nr:uncharacterized protein G2W53_001578 [Senna tora]
MAHIFFFSLSTLRERLGFVFTLLQAFNCLLRMMKS